MLELPALLSLVGPVLGALSKGVELYKNVSTIFKGNETERLLGQLISEQRAVRAGFNQLNGNILYAPCIEGWIHTTGQAHPLNDMSQVRALLEPMQQELGGKIVSSGLIETPDRMRRAMIQDPREVLEDIHPAHSAVGPADRYKVPVLFLYQGQRYIGWQKPRVLEALFNCEFYDLPRLGASLPRIGNLGEPYGQTHGAATFHAPHVSSVTFSRDGRKALFGSMDGVLKLQNLDKGAELLMFNGRHKRCIRSVAISRDGRKALSGSLDQTLKLWDFDSGAVIHTFQGHTGAVGSVAISDNGSIALSGSQDGTVRLWNLHNFKETPRTLEGHNDHVFSVAISPDGGTALSGSRDKTLKRWDLANDKKKPRTFEGHEAPVYSVAISRVGRKALSGSLDQTLKLWDFDSGKVIHTFQGHRGAVESVTISDDGRIALSGGEDCTVRLWDLVTREELHTFRGHFGTIYSVAISADSGQALSCSHVDNTLRLWSLRLYLRASDRR
jgi:hypothetical protein